MLFKLGDLIRTKVRTGKFIDLEHSNFFDKEGKFQKKNLIPLLGNWYANTQHTFVFTFCFKFVKMGGMNQGIVPIMTTLATLFNSILFYFYF